MKLRLVRKVYERLGLKYFSSCNPQSWDNVSSIETTITYDNQFEHLSNAVTPLANLDYNNQLRYKQNFTKTIVESIYKKKTAPFFRTKIFKIIPSPVTERYRNKDEFSINKGIDGDPKTVGFYVGSSSSGETVCVPPTELINTKKRHIEISQLFQEFIRISPLRTCLAFHDGGFWRNLIVRSNRNGEIMVTIIFHPNGASEEIKEETLRNLTMYFSEQNIDSLYYQACPNTRCLRSVAPYTLLYGKKHLYENLGPYKFQISPDSFFQINSETSEILYEKVIKFADVSKKSTLLDLCSGIGAISIFANSYVRGCVGIEILEEAVKDSVTNASLNSVNNCHFIAGKVEKKLFKVLKELDCSPDIVAVLNPGRSGVLMSTIQVLRRCPSLRTLIYIACKADNKYVMNNFMKLLDPKFDSSAPFILTEVQPVDLFPQTKHTEMIMVFKR